MSPSFRTGDDLSPADVWALIAAPDRASLAEHFGSLRAAGRVWRQHRAAILEDPRTRLRPPTGWWVFASRRPELADRVRDDPRVPANVERSRALDAERSAVLAVHPDARHWRRRNPTTAFGREEHV